MLLLKRVDGDNHQDTQSQSHIPLALGINPFGRGVLLGCEDKRVSRQHGHMEVFKDSILLKALSTNPCFLKKSGEETRVLKSGLNSMLRVGDQFGLLPTEHWYEVVNDPSSSFTECQQAENGTGATNDNTEPMDCHGSPDTSGTDGDNAATAIEATQRRRLHVGETDPSATPTANKLPRTDVEPINSGTQPSDLQSPNRQSTVVSNEEVRVKPDPDAPSIEQNLATVASNVNMAPDAVSCSTSSVNAAQMLTSSTEAAIAVTVKPDPDAAKPDKPDPAAKPALPTPARERCIYGAQCYRRNPQHKTAYSHPSDADWGSGPQGVCPWGAACQRRDPRHWQHHTHPPGTQQQPPAPHRQRGARSVVVRHGATFYIDAHAVHFHDDHFAVEDDDGSSVDYDYDL